MTSLAETRENELVASLRRETQPLTGAADAHRVNRYLTASLSRQFDALVHVDVTRALEPLERAAAWELSEPPETYPTAI